MSKAEERALEAYPEDWWFANPSDWGIIENPRKKDYNAEKRAVFILGYKQAEKDIMERAVETVVSLEPGANPVIEMGVGRFGLKVKDKVKVIIVKEDEK